MSNSYTTLTDVTRITLSAKDQPTLLESFRQEMGSVDPDSIFVAFRERLDACIQTNDLLGVLKLYDNKGLLALAASILGIRRPKELVTKASKLLHQESGADLRSHLQAAMPQFTMNAPAIPPHPDPKATPDLPPAHCP